MTKPIVFISHSSKNKDVATRLVLEFRSRGLGIWIDQEQIEFGEDLLDAIESGLKKSSCIIVLISPAFLKSKWCRAEYKSLLLREIETGKILVVPVLIEDCEIPFWLSGKLRADLRKIEAASETLDNLSKQIFERFNQETVIALKPSILSPPNESDVKAKTREERIVISLQERLKKDFFISGERKGEFGHKRIPNESHLFHDDSIREVLKHKPYYYLTYWGWYAMPKLLPDLVTKRVPVTAAALKVRFADKRWIEVDLEGYDSGPISVRARTVRHTAKAAEILLLNDDFEIPSQVAWDLVNEAHFLTNRNKGWKEFNTKDSYTSIWASACVFRFLSVIRKRESYQNVTGDIRQFIEKSDPLIQKTEEFLESHWRKHKWRLKLLPFEVNAPLVLIEYAPFAQNESLTESVYKELSKLLTSAGRLKNPALGIAYAASEYVLSVRLAYALQLTDSIKGRSDARVKRLIEWIINNYSEEYTFDTCDIAFLNELVTFTTTGAIS